MSLPLGQSNDCTSIPKILMHQDVVSLQHVCMIKSLPNIRQLSKANIVTNINVNLGAKFNLNKIIIMIRQLFPRCYKGLYCFFTHFKN